MKQVQKVRFVSKEMTGVGIGQWVGENALEKHLEKFMTMATQKIRRQRAESRIYKNDKSESPQKFIHALAR